MSSSISAGRTDRQKLEQYVKVVESCALRRAIREGTIKASFTLRAQAGQKLQSTADIGDEEDLRSLVLEFRKLVLKKDDANFDKVRALVGRYSPSDRERLRELKEDWTKAVRGDIRIKINGKGLSGDQRFNAWLNEELFHSDVAGGQLIAGLPDMVQVMVRQQLVSSLIDRFRAAWKLCVLVNVLLEREPAPAGLETNSP